MRQAAGEAQRTRQAARVFTEFRYRTRKSWSRARRVIAKAEQIAGKQNPGYVITSLPVEQWQPRQH
jgi:thiamine pyrophosphate-dependent acetolactate synthase large subunit-like protein